MKKIINKKVAEKHARSYALCSDGIFCLCL